MTDFALGSAFDPNPEAVLSPRDVAKPIPGCPRTVVSCFASNLVEYAAARYGAACLGRIHGANFANPLYCIEHRGRRLGLLMAYVGAPALTAQYEELFCMGAEQVVVFGNCGVLDASIPDLSILLPDCAVRDEGTSFHYAPPAETIPANVGTLAPMQAFLQARGVPYRVGKTWTTDAIYRETRDKVARRKAEGCISVDMECAALAALAAFRGKRIAQFFYCADNLDADEYEVRSLHNRTAVDAKQRVVELAIDLAWELDRAIE